MNGGRPTPDEYAGHFGTYVSLVSEDDVLAVLDRQPSEIDALCRTVATDREQYRYGPDKWSIREVIGHLIDGERVFGYRGFCFSRAETAGLPSFDENAYVARSSYDLVPLSELVAEFAAVRGSNVTYLRRLSQAEWSRRGTASTKTISVRALAFVMAGHVRHHAELLRSRYGLARTA